VLHIAKPGSLRHPGAVNPSTTRASPRALPSGQTLTILDAVCRQGLSTYTCPRSSPPGPPCAPRPRPSDSSSGPYPPCLALSYHDARHGRHRPPPPFGLVSRLCHARFTPRGRLVYRLSFSETLAPILPPHVCFWPAPVHAPTTPAIPTAASSFVRAIALVLVAFPSAW
jgi:hypothetical protein